MDTSLKPLVLNPTLSVTYVQDWDGILKVFQFLEEQSVKLDTVTGLDVETDMCDDWLTQRVRTIQVGNTEKQFVVDLLNLCNNDSTLLFDCQGDYGKNLYKAPILEKFIAGLANYLCGGKILWAGVNLGFEYLKFYWNLGIRIWNLFDCSVTERTIYAGMHSLKDYAFYSMHDMFARYFGYEIDKTLQTSFNLIDPLSWDQVEYAALDTRLPVAIRGVQNLIIKGNTVEKYISMGKTALADRLSRVPREVTGDNLEEIVRIENNSIGAFIDM